MKQMVLLVLTACRDVPSPSSTPTDTNSSVDVPLLTDTAQPTNAEVCDGQDNDGDNLIDEDFADEDSDGIADCMQCVLSEVEAAPQTKATSCSAPTITAPDNPWDIEVMWEYTYPQPGPIFFERSGCFRAAAADLDGDGGADIICHEHEDIINSGNGALRAISGADGTVLWSYEDSSYRSPVAVADVDSDGSVDVLHFNDDGQIVALEADGSLKWRSDAEYGKIDCEDSAPHCAAGLHLEAADLNGDGKVEVISHHGIVNGADGSSYATLYSLNNDVYSEPIAVGDFDQDGGQEIAYRGRMFDSDGSKMWNSFSDFEENSALYMPIPVQSDTDAQAELFWLQYSMNIITDHSGKVIYNEPAPNNSYIGHYNQLACGGDLDGDGDMELVVPYGSGDINVPLDSPVHAYNTDGSLLWTSYDFDISSVCATFDFNADGQDEIVLSAFYGFYILDGASGAILFEDTRATFPIDVLIVDVDGDGSVEIVDVHMYLGNQYVDTEDVGIRVYRHADGAWPPGSTIWAHRNWSGVGIYPNGEVATHPDAAWLTTGLFHGQPPSRLTGADLRPSLHSTCTAEAEQGEAAILLQIDNLGPQTARAGTPISIYTIDEDGAPTLYATAALPEDLPPQMTSQGIEVRFDSKQDAANGVRVVVGEGSFDCDSTNNTIDLSVEGR